MINSCVDYVLRMQDPNGGFAYQNSRGGRIRLTGLSVLCLFLTGHYDSPQMERAHGYLRKNYPTIPQQEFSLYSLYYNSQAAFQLGGETWLEVGDWMYKRYLPLQQKDGSWGNNVAGRNGVEQRTPAYRTSMVVLSLTVPYRQLPIYQRDETVDE